MGRDRPLEELPQTPTGSWLVCAHHDQPRVQRLGEMGQRMRRIARELPTRPRHFPETCVGQRLTDTSRQLVGEDAIWLLREIRVERTRVHGAIRVLGHGVLPSIDVTADQFRVEVTREMRSFHQHSSRLPVLYADNNDRVHHFSHLQAHCTARQGPLSATPRLFAVGPTTAGKRIRMTTLPDPDAGCEPDDRLPWCRMHIDLEPVAGSQLTIARMLVVADAAARSRTVLHREQVHCVVTGSKRTASPGPSLGSPPYLEYADTVEQAHALLGGVPDITVLAAAGSASSQPPGPSAPRPGTIRVGPVTWMPSVQSPLPAGDEHEINASRLMLLRFPLEEPAHVSLPRQRRANETLDRWRLKVAMWEEMPEDSPDPQIMQRFTDVLETPAWTAGTLVLLHRLESDLTTPSGAKFAAFMHMDRILGLDLGHLIGKVRH